MGKRVGGLKAELKEAKQADFEYQSALQRQRMGRQRLRKAEGHRKFRNGGLIQQVGMHELPLDLLLGALLVLKRRLEDPAFEGRGGEARQQALAEQAARKKLGRDPQEVFIAFDVAPPKDLIATLKALALRFNRRNMEWRGPANDRLLTQTVIAFGWDKHVVRSGYVQPPRGHAE